MNRRPIDYESIALPTEPQKHIKLVFYNYFYTFFTGIFEKGLKSAKFALLGAIWADMDWLSKYLRINRSTDWATAAQSVFLFASPQTGFLF